MWVERTSQRCGTQRTRGAQGAGQLSSPPLCSGHHEAGPAPPEGGGRAASPACPRARPGQRRCVLRRRPWPRQAAGPRFRAARGRHLVGRRGPPGKSRGLCRRGHIDGAVRVSPMPQFRRSVPIESVGLWDSQLTFAGRSFAFRAAASQTVASFEVKVEPPATAVKVVSVNDLGASTSANDNSDAFQRAVEACAGQPCTIQFAPGNYRFTQSLRVDGAKDLTIDGQGARLVFGFRSNFAPLLTVIRTDHFQLQNIAFDWNWGVYRIATLARTRSYREANGKSTWTVDLLDVQDFDPNTIYNWHSAFAVDPATMTIGLPNVNDIWELPVSVATKLGPAQIRLVLDTLLSDQGVAPEAGSYWLLRHFTYEVHAIWMESCTHCTLDKVNVYSTPGMAITYEDGSENIAIRNSRIGVFPGSARQISSATDGVHLAGTKGEILIENTEIANHGDDCINVNDPVSVGFRVLDARTIVANDWRDGRIVYADGDSVTFRNEDYTETGINLEVASASYQSGGWRIRFTGALPTFRNQTSKMFVINTSRYSARNVIIRGLHCHSNRARGVVLQAKNVVVEQSCFTNIQQEAISISSEIWLGHWAEGTGTVDTVIDSNVIAGVDKQNTGRGAIYSGASYSDGSGLVTPVHSRIVISNNVINQTQARAFTFQMVENLLMVNNTVVNADAASPNAGVVRVRKASNVKINSNRWAYQEGIQQRTPGAKVQIEVSSTSNVYGNNNLLLPLADIDAAPSSSPAAPSRTKRPTRTTTTTPEPPSPTVETQEPEPTVAPAPEQPADDAPTAVEEPTETATPTIGLGPIGTHTDPAFLENVGGNPLASVGEKITLASPIRPTGTAALPNILGT
ncbi:pectin lyase fold/virulence factor [Hyaloraphidium curvatum]|nr:pectin lyase fold/virulence factor [Hyaloraphidium curvatum]